MPTKPLLTSCLVALASLGTVATGGDAHAQHDVRSFLSKAGIDFLAQETPSYIPSTFNPPTLSGEFGGCSIFVEQSNTTINFNVDKVDITIPRAGRVQIAIEFSGGLEGNLRVENYFACIGVLTCDDSVTLSNGTAVFDYEISVEDGQAKVRNLESKIDLPTEGFNAELSSCNSPTTGGVINDVVGSLQGYVLTYLSAELSVVAQENLAPLLTDILAGFQFEGSLALASFSAGLSDLTVDTDGMAIGGTIDITDRFAPDPCIEAYDTKGGPLDLPGTAPALGGANAFHANMAVNLGLVNKGLYVLWRRGLMCLTDAHFAALGLELDLNIVGALLPGFPPGTKFSFEVKLENPPSMGAQKFDNSKLSFQLKGVILEFHGDRPDGSRNTLRAEIDIESSTTMGIDPASNAIYAQLDGAKISRLALSDERDATGAGFDVVRIKQMVHEHILPKMLDELGPLPLTGPVFAFNDIAVILRELSTTDSYLKTAIDFFKPPTDDTQAPNTAFSQYPEEISNPRDAVFIVSGNDPQIPNDLLQYEIQINGEMDSTLNFMGAFKVGEIGKTEKFTVSVAAVDLAGNKDPTPIEIDVTVDGISPQVLLIGPRTRPAEGGDVELTWTMSDDLTEQPEVQLDVYKVEDPTDVLSVRLIESRVLGRGVTSAMVQIASEPGGLYRAEIHVLDDAGNDSSVSVLLTIPSKGGCSIGGRSALANGGLLLLALGMLVAVGRRRQAQG